MARKNTVGLPKRSLLIPVLALTALVCGHSHIFVSSLLAAESDRSSAAMPDDMSSGMSDGMSVPPEASPPRGWLESLPEALALAEANGLPIVLHFEATWCVACRQMDSAVLNQPEVQKILSGGVIGVRIDADRHRDLISRYHVESLPTEVLLDATGKELSRHVGNVPMSTYLSRLNSLSNSGPETAVTENAASDNDDSSKSDADSDAIRSCLITHFDGKMVGMGGYSPVALIRGRQWKKGDAEFVATFQGVDYFLQSVEERDAFLKEPAHYIPQLHGVDLVALSDERRAAAGAIEFGSFYNGQLYFFASLHNRNQFQRNPSRYVRQSSSVQPINSEEYPFLKSPLVQGL